MYRFEDRVAHPNYQWDYRRPHEERAARRRMIDGQRARLTARNESFWSKITRALKNALDHLA